MGGIYILMVCAMWSGLLLIIMLLLAYGIAFFLKTPQQKKRLFYWIYAIYGTVITAYIVRIIQAYLS
jgi:hypothetical protein